MEKKIDSVILNILDDDIHKEIFKGSFIYDEKGRSICEYKPLIIKRKSTCNNIKKINIYLLEETKFYEGDKLILFKSQIKDEKGNIISESYYDNCERILKSIDYEDGNINKDTEYIYYNY